MALILPPIGGQNVLPLLGFALLTFDRRLLRGCAGTMRLTIKHDDYGLRSSFALHATADAERATRQPSSSPVIVHRLTCPPIRDRHSQSIGPAHRAGNSIFTLNVKIQILTIVKVWRYVIRVSFTSEAVQNWLYSAIEFARTLGLQTVLHRSGPRVSLP